MLGATYRGLNSEKVVVLGRIGQILLHNVDFFGLMFIFKFFPHLFLLFFDIPNSCSLLK